MFMFLYASECEKDELAANFDYYEPRCIHESSLSPSVHSILSCRLGRVAQAYEFFRFASRLDLDNYNRNTNEGLHTTSIAGSWMNIVYGFGGLISDGEMLSLSPCLPEEWKALRFPLTYRGSRLQVEIVRKGGRVESAVKLISGPEVEVMLNGKIRV
jgi:maltose phosphorylase